MPSQNAPTGRGDAAPRPEWGKADFLAHVLTEDRADADAAFERTATTGALDLRCRIVRAGDSATRWVAIRGWDAEGPTAMAGVVLDTTGRHLADERSSQSQKMEAIGQFTGGRTTSTTCSRSSSETST